jgi:hypothetical protein
LILLALLGPALWIWRKDGVPQRLGKLGQEYAATSFDTRYVNELSVSNIPQGFTRLGDTNASPSVFVWGDSHAMAIMPAIEEACKERHIGGLAATRSSTAPVLDWFRVTRYGLNDQAPSYNRAIMDYLERPAAKQTLKQIVIAAFWEGYVDSEVTSAGLQDALVHTVQRLHGCGYEVLLFDQVPTWSSKVPRALALRELVGWDSLKLKLADNSKDNTHHGLKMVFGDRMELLSHFKIMDPFPYFRDAQGEIMAADEKGAFFRDSQHLTTLGALRLQSAFNEFFAQASRS